MARLPCISFNTLPPLIEPEQLFLTNSLWMAWKVRWESHHMITAYVHMVHVSQGDTTSIISRFITGSTIWALASISYLGLGMMKAKGNYKKKRPQFYSFGTGEASLNLSTTCKDVNLEEYESISHLMRPFIVYGVIICTFTPPPQKLPLAFAIITYVNTLHKHLRTHTWDSVRKFHIVFHQSRISQGVYEPSGCSTPNHGLETAQLFKRMPADNARPMKRAHTAGRGCSSDEIWNNYNKDTCTYPTHRYTHACTICEGPHPATQCSPKQGAPLTQRISWG